MIFESGCRARAHASGRFRGDAIQPDRAREGTRCSRLWIAASLFVTALATNAMAAITVSGTISTNTTWSTGTGPLHASRVLVAGTICALVMVASCRDEKGEEVKLRGTELVARVSVFRLAGGRDFDRLPYCLRNIQTRVRSNRAEFDCMAQICNRFLYL